VAAADPHPAGPGPTLTATLRDREGRVYTVRTYRPADRDPLDRFYEAFEPKRAAQGLPPEGAERIGRWLDGVLATGTHLVVESDGRLVGHAMLMPTRDAGVREYAIFLDGSVRGRGVGTGVNLLSVELARAMRIDRLWLSVEPQNRAAVRSYQKAGYGCRPVTLFCPELEMELDLAPRGDEPPRPSGWQEI
jgi:RimJ/RimL family protein N-acetyltransferase